VHKGYVKDWAEGFLSQICAFPDSQHDDYVDSVSMALMRFRKGGYIRTNLDEPEEVQEFRRKREYY
jgi:phage terminase large subunit-like protein